MRWTQSLSDNSAVYYNSRQVSASLMSILSSKSLRNDSSLYVTLYTSPYNYNVALQHFWATQWKKAISPDTIYACDIHAKLSCDSLKRFSFLNIHIDTHYILSFLHQYLLFRTMFLNIMFFLISTFSDNFLNIFNNF